MAGQSSDPGHCHRPGRANPGFPTAVHRQAAGAIVDFAMASPVQAVVLVNSCARGTATPESDLDIALLIDPGLPAEDRQLLERAWRGPEWLPSLVEIRNPSEWISRVGTTPAVSG